MTRTVRVSSGAVRYAEQIWVGPHALLADEPSDVGGNDVGPNPYELLLAALGACASITVRMYAERKRWPLEDVQIRLSLSRIHAEDCDRCDTEVGTVDRIEAEIYFTGDLSGDQQLRLLEIANKCPVHRTLGSGSRIDMKLLSSIHRGT
jgi:putative redox protein